MKKQKIPLREKRRYFAMRTKHWFYEFFKMYDYELYIDADGRAEERAATHWGESESLQLVISYNPKWLSETDDFTQIDKTAFHEAAEGFLWELSALAENGGEHLDGLVQMTVHRIIRRMENVIFPMAIKMEIEGYDAS